MCYSFRSSVSTFFIAIVTVFLMFKRRTKVDMYLAPFILTYAFMQFTEAFMWYDQKCGIINKIGSHLAYFDLIIQLFAVGVGIYLVEGKKHGMIIGALVALYYLINMPKIKCSTYKNNTMYWGFNATFYRYLYALSVVLVFLSKMPFRYKIFLVLWYTASWLYFFHKQIKDSSLLNILYYKNFDGNYISSLWCHMCSFSAPALYFIQYVF